MEWHKDILINNDRFCPENLLYDGRVYYRYMDKIYIPKPPSELNKNQVAWLSEVRLKLANEIIDYDYSLDVIEELYRKTSIDKGGSVLDFGCGGGMFLNFLVDGRVKNTPNLVVGLDISNYAITQANKYFLMNSNDINLIDCAFDAKLFDEAGLIDMSDNSVDGAISSFVMHFEVYNSQMKEIFRVLKPNGKFCFNDYVYNKYPAHSKKVHSILKEIGFELTIYNKSFKNRISNSLKNHLMVIATKPHQENHQ